MYVQKQIGVLLVDDHPVLRDGLAALIGPQPDMCVLAEAGTADVALRELENCSPDVVLLDLILPDKDGTELARIIRRHRPKTNIVVLTNSNGDQDIVKAFEAGVSGYLLKTSARQDILTAIRTVHAGYRFLPPDVATALALNMTFTDLSNRELAVLRLAAGGLRNKEIAGSLNIAEPTVKEHMRNILSKLHVSDRTAAVVSAIRRGILHLPFLP